MRSAWTVYGLLLVASLLYCLGLFTGLDQWGRGDWDQFSFRYETPRLAMLRDGQLPLWNPYAGGGNVLLAHPHCPALSPWYLPTLVLGAPLGLRVAVLMFVAFGTTGMAALLRRWGVSAAGCFVGGVLVMMNAHFTMHVTEGHLEWCALGLVPWVLLCLERARADWRYAVFAALLTASALLHGSVYVVAVFVPLFGLWAALESYRRRRWRPLAGCAVAIGLTVLLSAVVLLPRMEFVRANPRDTRRHEQISPTQFGRMLLDPRQADFYRKTRDVRNPSDQELAQLLPSQLAALARKFETRPWHRLDVVFTTTADWSELNFEGFPYVLLIGDPEPEDRGRLELETIPLSNVGLAIRNPRPSEPASMRATLYAHLPERGDMQFTITRGNIGQSELSVTRGDKELMGAVHRANVPGDLSNRRTFTIERDAILGRDEARPPRSDATWYRLDAVMTTTADWGFLEVIDCPYLFAVEEPETERRNPVRLLTRLMSVSGRAPGDEPLRRRASLYVCPPEQGDLQMEVNQGRIGSTALELKTPQGAPLLTVAELSTAAGGEKKYTYRVPHRVIQQQLDPLPMPLRWRLDRSGMADDWHEYACYVTWAGLAVALCGMVVFWRRHWPLAVVGLVAGLVALGASLPLDLWALSKLLPLYGSLQVSARLLMAVVFVAAVCGGYGVDFLGRWAKRKGGTWFRRALECGLGLAICVELTVLAWSLFGDVFVCPPRPVPGHEDRGFAQRYAEDEVCYASMYSAHYPYLLDDSGVLREYENIAIPRGKVRLTGDPDYRGEAYLESGHGTAQVVDWSMSRVRIALKVDSLDRLVLNQNYFPGWKAVRRGVDGTWETLYAKPAPGKHAKGLVSIPVRPGVEAVELYYLPDSFLLGVAISLATLLGCVGFLLVGRSDGRLRRRLVLVVARMLRRSQSWLRPAAVRYAACAVALNLPFLLFHPGRTLIEAPLLRSLAVGAVLLLAPGLPLVGALIGRRWLPRGGLLWAIAASLVMFVAVLIGVHLIGLPVTGATVWNVTWVLTNLGLLLSVLAGGPAACGLRLQDKFAWVGVLMFAVAYLAFFHGATMIVPVMDDHDYETQGTAYGLLTRLEMTLLTDRDTIFCYAHPPLTHLYVAGSFLYFGQKDDLAYYDAAWHRAELARQGGRFKPVVDEFFCLPEKNRLVRKPGLDDRHGTPHRIVGVDGKDYVVSPPLPEGKDWPGGDRISVREMEVQMIYDRFRQNSHHRLPTRATNVFLAALVVGLLGWWIARMTGRWWLGPLAASAFAANPEVFVRSSYGGYFAITMFAAVQVLLAVEAYVSGRSRSEVEGQESPCRPVTPSPCHLVLAGAFAGLSNHKLVLLPAALVVWHLMQPGQGPTPKRAVRALLDPVVIGFAAGTMIFWAYGLTVSPDVFWLEHVRYHLVDRIVHENPLGYGLYPSVSELWLEFWRHTGYVLLPLAAVALAALCAAKRTATDRGATDSAVKGWCDTPGYWAVWALLTAVAFSLVDWRQTKHLMPLLLPMHLAAARWAASGRAALVIVTVALAGLLLWDLEMLQLLATNFDDFPITPAW